MNRSVTPKKNASQLQRTPSSHQRSSAAKSPAKRNPFSEGVEEMLRSNREKLSHTLDTYTMLIRSNNPIRCLEHNSVVSIFCETEGRLLCTNCVFASNHHKFHKINPVDKSQHKLRESIESMKPQIEKEIDVLEKIKEIVLINLDQEMADLEKGMAALTLSYAQAHQLLEDNLTRAKTTLLSSIEQLKVRHQTVALELNFLRDVYDVKLPLLNLDFNKVETDQVLIYHHSLLYTLATQKKFQGNVWNVPRNQIRRLCSEEDRKIAAINLELTRHLALPC